MASRHEPESSPPWLVEVLDRARTAHVVLDPAGRILWVNPATAQMAGGDARDLIGWDATVLMPLDVAGEVRARMAALLEHGSFEHDVVHVRADGRRGYSRIRSEVVPEADGSPRWILVEVQDLSDLQDQLERLNQTALSLAADSGEELLTAILRAARTLSGARYAALGIADDEGRLVRFIPDGMTEEAIAGIDHWPDGHGLLGAMIAERRTINVPKIAADPRSSGFPAGHPVMTSFLGVPIIDGDEVHGHLYLADKQGTESFTPIDERLAELFAAHAAAAIHSTRQREKLTLALAALRESESGFRFQATILGNVHDSVIVTDMNGRIAYWNQGAEAVFGYSSTEMLGETPAILYPDMHPARVVVGLGRIAAGEDFAGEWQGRRKDGSLVWVELRTTVLRDGAGEPLGFIGVAHDVTTRKRAEAERDRMTTALAQTGDAVTITDPDGRIVYVNAAFERLYGYASDEAVGSTQRIINSGRHTRAFWEETFRSVDGGQTWAGDLVDRRRDGSLVEVDSVISPMIGDDGRLLGRVEVARDATHERQLEAQLRHGQKMEAVGRLAGGVAHDFNNLLTVIMGHAQSLLVDGGLGDDRREDVQAIEQAAQRAAALTRQLLAFSRRQVIQPTVLDTNEVVRGVMPMLARLLGEDIALSVRSSDDPLPVLIDAGQLEQVIVNLAVNARDAMPTGGALTIEAAAVEVDPAYAASHPGATAGPAVLLTVSDTGEGIDPADLEHIFEPFFTTKEVGRGTGLGLATVYAIVKQAGGHIWVDTRPAAGASFRIYLPRAAGELTPLSVAGDVDRALRGTETILLVEDEPAVRRFAVRCLEGLGYTVLAAQHADEALVAWRASAAPISLVVTDVVLPGIRGGELVKRLRAGDPALRVLFISGYPEDEALRLAFAEKGARLLEKPFAPDQLGRAVRDVLDAQPA